MNLRLISASQGLHRARSLLFRSLQVLLITTIALGPLLPMFTPPVQAAPRADLTSILHLSVISARTEPEAFDGLGVLKGAAISQYKYIINIDNTGTTEQRSPEEGCSPANDGYPESCNWTSIKGIPNSSPIYTQGDQSDINAALAGIPDGRYLITVLAAGYKMDGAHFTVPMEADANQLYATVTVEMQPNPLPTATVMAQIFEDNAPTNSAPDIPAELGLAGFEGHIFDYIDEVTTDVFGNPLCTEYEPGDGPNGYLYEDGAPVPIEGTGGKCVSKSDGVLTIPNLGPNRYALSVVPPDGTNWIQTTTLEGNHDWDAWVMEGATGFDTEFVVAGEPFPAIFFGFVQSTALPSSPATGEIKGVVDAVKAYVPSSGGLNLPNFNADGGLGGVAIDKPISKPWIALNDLDNSDVAVYVGQGNDDGTFDIHNVPDGNYTLSYWDEPQDYILQFVQVTITGGEVVDLGILPLTGWWTPIDGYVFEDSNRNGVMDPDEHGLAGFPVVMKKRENSVMDRGTVVATTDENGYYFMESTYPMTQWLVQEAYSDNYYTTGITYQTDNQTEPTTVLGAGVDVSVLPIIGLGGRLDWGVHAYDADGASGGLDPRNGGIVGTVSYDTTRNELDPRFAAVEDWQPGISGLTVNLYLPVPCPNAAAACDAGRRYQLDADGSYSHLKQINSYVTETWERPKGCVARDVDGNPLQYPSGQQVLPTDPDAECLEGPLMGVQFGPNADGQGGDEPSFGASVDGNYGFGDGCFDGTLDATDPADPQCDGAEFTPLTAQDYLVEVEIPLDAKESKPQYKVTREEDINIFTGDQYVPQIPPPACAGALHIVDVAGVGTDGYPALNLPGGVTVPASTATANPDFMDGGGSPYEGMAKPLCDTKLVTVSNGRSIAPTFNYFTDVPLPGRFWGLIVDDLNISNEPKSLLYGEKAGVPFAPVGIYDYTNRLVYTVESDYNGLWDVLLPSTNRISCPTPSGVCSNLYRFVGNDPGTPGHLNSNYNPLFRTIAAEFEAFPGLIVPADLAPTQVGAMIQVGTGRFSAAVLCTIDTTTPQIFAVDKPYVRLSDSDTLRTVTIDGLGFGAPQGAGQITLDGVPLAAPAIISWVDKKIEVRVPTTTANGPHQLMIKAANGRSTVNGLTFHVLGTPTVPFPANTTLLDSFNRTSLNSLFNPSWLTSPVFPSPFTIVSNAARVAFAGTASMYKLNPSSYGANQEAYFTFTQVSSAASATEQGLYLKADTNFLQSSYIAVVYDRTVGKVRVITKNASSSATMTRATLPNSSATVSFAAGDSIGARAADDGTVTVWKKAAASSTWDIIGSVDVSPGINDWDPVGSAAAGSGALGVRFTGTAANEARFDNFSGGNFTVAAGASYDPTVYEVGPGKSYATIQAAINEATVDNPTAGALVVVYPGAADLDNPRNNPRGAYYENLVIFAPIKLQGVGPGGFQDANTWVPGSVIDGGAFGGDGVLADAWRNLVASLTWVGNQTVYDSETIMLLARAENQYGATFKAAIDGFDLRGGDQQGFPGNINNITGAPTGVAANAITQGGAVYANAYVKNLQITNNVVENNGGAYGTIRIGTPNLPQPDTSQHNDNVRIAYNRIVANGGTNLAGAIGIFAGSNNYEVAYNDICGNFSTEYGGGISVYGLSPKGQIHHNRIYFNESYDEGGGIMIAGELPASPLVLSPGSGDVKISNNLIQSNLSNDDGGGIRFLMAGNYPITVTNNIIVNNISTHEGGGIALDDTSNVRVFNNTIMKNLTTATAVTSLGQPAPAGLSTAENSVLLQQNNGGAPIAAFTPPLVFNNIFWDNRAGTRTIGEGTLTGLGLVNDITPINYWDLGVAGLGESTQLLAPTNSVVKQDSTLHPYTTAASNQTGASGNPLVIAPYDTGVSFNQWRTNPNFVDAIMTVGSLTPSLGNYHLPAGSSPYSPAIDKGAANKNGVTAPVNDIDDGVRPVDFAAVSGPFLYDIGADEVPGPVVDFPSNGVGVLDAFSGAAGPVVATGSNWSNVNNGSVYLIGADQRVQIQTGTALPSASDAVNDASIIWNTTSFGPSQEAGFTFGVMNMSAPRQGLVLKLTRGATSGTDSFIAVTYNDSIQQVQVWTHTAQGTSAPVNIPATFVAGDKLGARAMADGSVTVFKNGEKLPDAANPVNVSAIWPPELVAGGGRIGLYFNTANGVSVIDDFTGGTMPTGGIIGSLTEVVDPDAAVTDFSDAGAILVDPEFATGTTLFLPSIEGAGQTPPDASTPAQQPGQDTLYLPATVKD